MNKVTKEQRDQLIAIAMGTVMLMAALWFFGVRAKQAELGATRKKTADMQKTRLDGEAKIHLADEIAATLQRRKAELDKREAGLAPDRDTYAWVINTMASFIQSRNGVNIDSYSQPEFSETGLIPRFPYHWATFHLKGSGYYQDLGKFFMDFENAYPYFRIQSPTLTANIGPGMEPEKLSVTFDLVTPVISSQDKK